MSDDDNKKLDPDLFPQRCQFKVIAEDQANVRTRIENTLRDLGLKTVLNRGRSSSGGHYISFQFDAEVDSADTMRGVVRELSRVNGVKIVL